MVFKSVLELSSAWATSMSAGVQIRLCCTLSLFPFKKENNAFHKNKLGHQYDFITFIYKLITTLYFITASVLS